jgi:hypothetical protein
VLVHSARVRDVQLGASADYEFLTTAELAQ